MVEALRGLGYSPATALADIIDNSISANARNVALDFKWQGDVSVVSILDDGNGMDEANLESAMRLGERSPVDQRTASDLGRFGLGLKTASFSQCRSLTVASIRSGETNCLRWDLDVLASSADHGWHLLKVLHTDRITFSTLCVRPVKERLSSGSASIRWSLTDLESKTSWM